MALQPRTQLQSNGVSRFQVKSFLLPDIINNMAIEVNPFPNFRTCDNSKFTFLMRIYQNLFVVLMPSSMDFSQSNSPLSPIVKKKSSFLYKETVNAFASETHKIPGNQPAPAQNRPFHEHVSPYPPEITVMTCPMIDNCL